MASGITLNNSPNFSEPINVGLDFNCKRLNTPPIQRTNISQPNFSSSDAQIVTLLFSSIAPALPIFLNSKRTWTEDKSSALVSQFLGQSAVLGSSEFIRHFSIVIDNTFQQKCNLSAEMCRAWTSVVLPLVNQASKPGLCLINETDTTEMKLLYDSAHSMPNTVFAVVGSSVVVFFANLFFWTRYNKNNKDLVSAHYSVKLLMIIMFVIFITVAVLYRFKEKSQSVTDLALSFFFGVIVQFVMTFLYQVKKMTRSPVGGHSPIVKITDDFEMKTCSSPLNAAFPTAT